jgi:hypothetical protein
MVYTTSTLKEEVRSLRAWRHIHDSKTSAYDMALGLTHKHADALVDHEARIAVLESRR